MISSFIIRFKWFVMKQDEVELVASSASGGLGSLWVSLSEVYNLSPRVYERGSLAVSLFQIRRWRAEALRVGMTKESIILDAGSGKGALSEILRQRGVPTIMMDANFGLLKAGYGDRVQGMFERPPFRAGVFDYVVMSFSLHAAGDYGKAIEGMRAVLKRGGFFLSVGIGKPRSLFKLFLINAYLTFAVPLLAVIATGRNYRFFKQIKVVFRVSPTNDELKSELGAYFQTLSFKEFALGAVYEFLGEKPRALCFIFCR